MRVYIYSGDVSEGRFIDTDQKYGNKKGLTYTLEVGPSGEKYVQEWGGSNKLGLFDYLTEQEYAQMKANERRLINERA